MGKIEVHDVRGGAYATSDDILLYNARADKIPRGCAINAWTYFDETDDTLQENLITFKGGNSNQLSASCVSGLVSCEWTYSDELIDNINECSIENGNLIDANDLVEGEIYDNIEQNNGGPYSGILSKLVKQDETRDNGASEKMEVLKKRLQHLHNGIEKHFA